MSKPLDYYSGYPGQQGTPKWVGVTIGSVFGGVTLVALAIGIRLVIPAHKAEASVAPPVVSVAPAIAPAPAAPAAVAAVPVADEAAPAPAHHRGHAAKKSGYAVAMSHAAKGGKKPQLFAKRSAPASARNKHSRDDLDKLLGI